MEGQKEYSIKEICEIYNISSVTLDRYRRKGLPFYKRGRSVFFKIEEVESWMQKYKKVEKFNTYENKEKVVN